MKSKRWPIWLTLVIVLGIGFFWGIYAIWDPEQLTLSTSTRERMPGQFAQLTDGYTHYELGGPEGGHVVLLAACFSCRYFFCALIFLELSSAGFRVFRYDYYVCGYSDRPSIAF